VWYTSLNVADKEKITAAFVNMFQKYSSAEWKAEKGDFWTPTYMSVHSIAYNKNLLAGATGFEI
jgi:hypothetical protein